jgi:hypothetical protein
MARKKKARMGRPPKAGAKRYSIRITDAVAWCKHNIWACAVNTDFDELWHWTKQ